MEKEIFDTKQKQRSREQSFLISQTVINKIEKISRAVVTDLIQRLKNDAFTNFYWGDHTLTVTLDEYYSAEYSVVVDSVSLWVANGKDYLEFYEHDHLKYVPDDLRGELWDVVLDVKNATKLRVGYKEYQKQKSSKKTEIELKKQTEIEEAKKVLEKYETN